VEKEEEEDITKDDRSAQIVDKTAIRDGEAALWHRLRKETTTLRMGFLLRTRRRKKKGGGGGRAVLIFIFENHPENETKTNKRKYEKAIGSPSSSK